MNTFGERLRSEREKRGFNQKEFAEAIGVTPTRLNYWEKDKREPDFPNIRKIIDILECDADYLLGTKFSASSFDESKKQVLESIDALSDEQVNAVSSFIKYLTESTKE